jgi:hypothetical protein
MANIHTVFQPARRLVCLILAFALIAEPWDLSYALQLSQGSLANPSLHGLWLSEALAEHPALTAPTGPVAHRIVQMWHAESNQPTKTSTMADAVRDFQEELESLSIPLTVNLTPELAEMPAEPNVFRSCIQIIQFVFSQGLYRLPDDFMFAQPDPNARDLPTSRPQQLTINTSSPKKVRDYLYRALARLALDIIIPPLTQRTYKMKLLTDIVAEMIIDQVDPAEAEEFHWRAKSPLRLWLNGRLRLGYWEQRAIQKISRKFAHPELPLSNLDMVPQPADLQMRPSTATMTKEPSTFLADLTQRITEYYGLLKLWPPFVETFLEILKESPNAREYCENTWPGFMGNPEPMMKCKWTDRNFLRILTKVIFASLASAGVTCVNVMDARDPRQVNPLTWEIPWGYVLTGYRGQLNPTNPNEFTLTMEEALMGTIVDARQVADLLRHLREWQEKLSQQTPLGLWPALTQRLLNLADRLPKGRFSRLQVHAAIATVVLGVESAFFGYFLNGFLPYRLAAWFQEQVSDISLPAAFVTLLPLFGYFSYRLMRWVHKSPLFYWKPGVGLERFPNTMVLEPVILGQSRWIFSTVAAALGTVGVTPWLLIIPVVPEFVAHLWRDMAPPILRGHSGRRSHRRILTGLRRSV